MTNEEIIKNRPQFIIVDEPNSAIRTFTVRLLPYTDYEIKNISENSDKNQILFNYSLRIYDSEYWDSYYVTIKNIGSSCCGGFLHLQDKSEVNIYHELNFNENSHIPLDFYCERVGFTQLIKEGETLRIEIFYPKAMQALKRVPLDLYLYDEFENFWFQEAVNMRCSNDSYPISPEEYRMNYSQEIMQWFVIDRLYYEVKNPLFHNAKIQELLERKLNECYNKLDEFEQYTRDVKAGKILLKSNK